MHKSDQTHVAFGSALLAVGLGGVIALVLGAQEGDWQRLGFRVLFVGVVLLAAIGAYALVAVYTPRLWLPLTRADRELNPRLSVSEVEIDRVSGHDLEFLVVFHNTGRGRITRALVEIIVPANLDRIDRIRGRQTTGEGQQASSTVSLDVDEAGNPLNSIYWYGEVDFGGRATYPIYLRTGAPPTGVLRVRVKVTAEELDSPLHSDYTLTIPEEDAIA